MKNDSTVNPNERVIARFSTEKEADAFVDKFDMYQTKIEGRDVGCIGPVGPQAWNNFRPGWAVVVELRSK